MDRDVVANTLGAAAMRLLELRLIKYYPVAQPAIGQDWIKTVPGGVIWELLSVSCRLVTSATVANRNVTLNIKDSDGNTLERFAGPQPIAANTPVSIQFAEGLGVTGFVGSWYASLPHSPIVLSPGFSVGTITGSIDGGDQFSQVVLCVREWSESDVLQELRMIAQQLTSQVMPEIIG